jgi:hypothetical protein
VQKVADVISEDMSEIVYLFESAQIDFGNSATHDGEKVHAATFRSSLIGSEYNLKGLQDGLLHELQEAAKSVTIVDEIETQRNVAAAKMCYEAKIKNSTIEDFNPSAHTVIVPDPEAKIPASTRREKVHNFSEKVQELIEYSASLEMCVQLSAAGNVSPEHLIHFNGLAKSLWKTADDVSSFCGQKLIDLKT